MAWNRLRWAERWDPFCDITSHDTDLSFITIGVQGNQGIKNAPHHEGRNDSRYHPYSHPDEWALNVLTYAFPLTGINRQDLLDSVLLLREDLRLRPDSGFHQAPALCNLVEQSTCSRHWICNLFELTCEILSIYCGLVKLFLKKDRIVLNCQD